MKNIMLFCLLITNISQAQQHYDIVIDEIMADPSPAIGLPGYEWIELKNISSSPINLQNYRFGDASGISGSMPTFILQPDSFVIVCAATALPSLSAFGNAISVTSFPSLDKDGDELFLRSATGIIVDAVRYSSSWYGNELKKEGGWTLEMIDTKNPCMGSNNWKASIDNKGGTPGQLNSVASINMDSISPILINAYSINDTTVIIVYNKPVDSISGATAINYAIDGGLTVIRAKTIPPLFDKVQLTLYTAMNDSAIYTITATNVKDCEGNTTNSDHIKTAIPAEAVAGKMVINEILFNPRPNGFDYVEFYNNSHTVFDAASLSIANRNGNNVISSIKTISTSPCYIFPGDYIVITENPDNLALNYLVRYPAQVITIASLPSFPDQQGNVVLLNKQGEIVDEVDYTEDWHFNLLNNKEGVSLERIDPSGLSGNPQNWHSAASTAGYGTPGYKNSQYKNQSPVYANIEVTPVTFSPDNDGHDDIATISYKVDRPGYVASITIFDGAGRPVRNLVRNALLGNSGYWNWDGLGDKGQRLPIGPYIVFTELFNLQGKKKEFKKVVVLARNLK